LVRNSQWLKLNTICLKVRFWTSKYKSKWFEDELLAEVCGGHASGVEQAGDREDHGQHVRRSHRGRSCKQG